MSDQAAIARAIKVANENNGGIIDHGTARAIASGYSDNNTYSFVSTGNFVESDDPDDVASDALMRDFIRGVDSATLESNADELNALRAYLEYRDDMEMYGPVDGWSNMWVSA